MNYQESYLFHHSFIEAERAKQRAANFKILALCGFGAGCMSVGFFLGVIIASV